MHGAGVWLQGCKPRRRQLSSRTLDSVHQTAQLREPRSARRRPGQQAHREVVTCAQGEAPEEVRGVAREGALQVQAVVHATGGQRGRRPQDHALLHLQASWVGSSEVSQTAYRCRLGLSTMQIGQTVSHARESAACGRLPDHH